MSSKHVEGADDTFTDNVEDTNRRTAMPAQKTTRLMGLFSLYIALAGWIYNFDLGKMSAVRCS